jgi:hypothetical protein
MDRDGGEARSHRRGGPKYDKVYVCVCVCVCARVKYDQSATRTKEQNSRPYRWSEGKGGRRGGREGREGDGKGGKEGGREEQVVPRVVLLIRDHREKGEERGRGKRKRESFSAREREWE